MLADLRQENAKTAAEVFRNAGFEVATATVDVSSRTSVHALVEQASALGEITHLIHAAGVSPSQASPTTILTVDLYGTALVLEEFGNVTHITGCVQPRSKWLSEMTHGQFRYHTIEPIGQPQVVGSGNTARLTHRIITDASVY